MFAAITLHILLSDDYQEKTTDSIAKVITDKKFSEMLSTIITYAHDPTYKRGWRTVTGEPTVTHPFIAHTLTGTNVHPIRDEVLSAKSPYES